MPIISIQNLTKDFGAVRAVDDLSFDIDEGKVVGFLGPNGSGKTTTLRSLVGLVTPTSGTATIHGVRYAELRRPAVADRRHARGRLASGAHRPQPPPRARGRGAASRVSRADEMLELVDLGGAARRRSGGFSLGMTQRLGLAAALLGDPQILVLDEPANGLDPEGIRWLRDFLRGLAAEGRTVLLSSHVLSEVAQTVDEVVVINHGRLITHSPLAALSSGAGPRVRVRSPQLRAARRGAGRARPRRRPRRARRARRRRLDARRRSASSRSTTASSSTRSRAESSNLEDVFFDLTSTPELEVVAS